MTHEELKQRVLSLVPNAEIVDGKEFPIVTVAQNKLFNLAKSLREGEDTCFDYLFCLTGMDWIDSLGVIYHLRSTKYNHEIELKIKTPNRENPQFDSVCAIWKTAEFLEREVYDLMGINFKNHPDLRRIFLDDTWVGHPQRKDYSDEVNIIER